MDKNIIGQLKNIFKEQKKYFFWGNINIDDLSDECIWRNSVIVLQENKVVYYTKFTPLINNMIEKEFTYNAKPFNAGLVAIDLNLYDKLLKKKFEIHLSVFKENKISISCSNSVGGKKMDTMFSFCMVNPFYDKGKATQYFDQTLVLSDNAIVRHNDCYLFYETDKMLNNDDIEIVKKLAKDLNIKYMVFFSKIPNKIINNYPYKIVYTFKVNKLSDKALKLMKKPLKKEFCIINNLEFF